MEIREFAQQIFGATSLEGKLFQPPEGFARLTDTNPGDARFWSLPGRPEQLQIAPKKKRKKIPHPDALHDPQMRIRCLHTFANHELMALELMAWAILAFPDAPPSFRRGLVWLIEEEQKHLSMYMERIDQMSATFGDLPVNDHFWRIAPSLTTPAKWVCAMNLTFEQANLDHALFYRQAFLRVEDTSSADLMTIILEDEIKHVGFGVRWLEQFAQPEEDLFDAFVRNLTEQSSPERARGPIFNAEARRAARLPESFIEKMQDHLSVSSQAKNSG